MRYASGEAAFGGEAGACLAVASGIRGSLFQNGRSMDGTATIGIDAIGGVTVYSVTSAPASTRFPNFRGKGSSNRELSGI